MTIYLVFDLDNGDPSGAGTHAYVWWFKSWKKAMAHRRHVKRLRYGTRLSMPKKAKIL